MSLNPAVTQHYSLGPVKPWVEKAAYTIGLKFGVKSILGWRASDPFPDHPSGHALDFMVSNKGQGQAIADFAVANASALGIKYVIWNRQVWEASGKPVPGWHPYTSTSNPHTDHVHITFNDQPGSASTALVSNDTSKPGMGAASPECAWGFHVPVAGDMCILTKVQVRSLMGAVLIASGAVVVLAGVAFLIATGLKESPAAGVAMSFVPGGKLVSSLGK